MESYKMKKDVLATKTDIKTTENDPTNAKTIP